MDESIRGVLGVLIVLAILGLLAFGAGTPDHRSTTQSAAIGVVTG
jgi:hypothetical protein